MPHIIPHQKHVNKFQYCCGDYPHGLPYNDCCDYEWHFSSLFHDECNKISHHNATEAS